MVMLFGTEVPVIELVLAAVVLLLIIVMVVGSTLLLFFGQDLVNRSKYPVKVPGWRTRMAEHPPFNATPHDIGRMNQLILKHAVAKGYKKRAVKKMLNNSFIHWVKADPGLGGRRAVVDPWNRTVLNGNGNPVPLLVAGWHSGNVNHVVFVAKDVIERTAYTHEVGGHGVHSTIGRSDYDHRDKTVFGAGGVVALVKNEMHNERLGEDPEEPLDEGIEVKEV